VVLGLWGAELDRHVGYTLTLTGTKTGDAILRHGTRLIATAELPPGKAARSVTWRRGRRETRVVVDGETVIHAEADERRDAGAAWRVGVRAAARGATYLSDVRITGSIDQRRREQDGLGEGP
jgi:hypothetical protein